MCFSLVPNGQQYETCENQITFFDMTKQEIINAVFNRNVYTNEFRLGNLLDKLIKSKLLKFQVWLSDEDNDIYDEILISEYLEQCKKLDNDKTRNT